MFAAKGYVVFRSTSSTGTYTQVADVVDNDHYIDPGLTFNKIYYYKVQAYALVDGVKVLGSASAIKYAKTALSQVTGQSAVSTAYNNNRISWPAVAGATGYQIYYSTGTSTSFVFLKSLTSTSFNHSGITTARTYNCRVRAYRLVGTTTVYGAFSSTVSASPIPAVQTGLNVVSGGFSSLKATWSAVSGASGYEVSYATTIDGYVHNVAVCDLGRGHDHQSAHQSNVFCPRSGLPHGRDSARLWGIFLHWFSQTGSHRTDAQRDFL